MYAKVDNIINVSRNDFRPPPQVESSVIRLVPIDPPPPIKFEEFDGLNRIIFSRPNKTIRGNFQAKGVMKMLEQNRSTWLSLQNMVRFINHPPPLVRRMLTETNGIFFFIGRHQPIDDDRSISSIVDNLLEELGYTESRAAKMDIDDLLKYVFCGYFFLILF